MNFFLTFCDQNNSEKEIVREEEGEGEREREIIIIKRSEWKRFTAEEKKSNQKSREYDGKLKELERWNETWMARRKERNRAS